MKSYTKIPSFVGFQHSTAVETKKHLHCLNLWLSSWGAFSKIVRKWYVIKQNMFYSINLAIAPVKMMMRLHLTLKGALVFKHNAESEFNRWNPSSCKEGKVHWFHYVWDLTLSDCISLHPFSTYIHHSANMRELKCNDCHLLPPLAWMLCQFRHTVLFCLRESWPR